MSVSEENTVEEPEQFRKLFIGGLHYNTTKDSLKAFFGKWGDIVDVVVIKHPVTKRPRGFGFVTYSKTYMVDDAMANRPHTIDGRKVDAKRAVLRDDMFKPDITCTVKKMFVSGIKELTEEELQEYFGQYGNILNIKIIIDRETGQRKGYGFIEFDDSDSVDKAVCLIKNHEISGNKLQVRKALGTDGVLASRGRRGGRGAGNGRGQILGGSNYFRGGYNFGGGYGGGSRNGLVQGSPQGWNNVLDIRANYQGGWICNRENYWEVNQSGYGTRPLHGIFYNRDVFYHTGGSGYFHQNARGQYCKLYLRKAGC